MRRILTALRHWPDHGWLNFWCDVVDVTGTGWLPQPIFDCIYDHWAAIIERLPEDVDETCGVFAHHGGFDDTRTCCYCGHETWRDIDLGE